MAKSAECKKCKKELMCPACDKVKGRKLNKFEIHKIWEWTKEDLEKLFAGFKLGNVNGVGPSNGYSIYLVCLMDIWGGIFNADFGGENTQKNIITFLKLLRNRSREDYCYRGNQLNELCKIIRHNFVHSYGLKSIHNQSTEYWLNVDVVRKGPVINLQSNQRWHVNCFKLKNDIREIIESWLEKEGI